MGTTEIPPERTAAEIEALLVKAKARHVSKEYDSGQLAAMRFCLNTPHGDELWYRMPIRWKSVWERMKKIQSRSTRQEQAQRTAWRQVLRWLEAQIAFLECESTTPFETFLPYMIDANDRTVGEIFAERHNYPMLPAGSGK